MHTKSEKETARFMKVCDLYRLLWSGQSDSAYTLQHIEREEKNLIVAKHPNVALFYGVSEVGLVTSAPAAPGLVTLYYPNENVMDYLRKHPEKALLNDRLRLVSS